MPEKQLDFFGQNSREVQFSESILRKKTPGETPLEDKNWVWAYSTEDFSTNCQNHSTILNISKKNPQNDHADTKTLVYRKPVMFVLQEVRRENTVKFFLRKNFWHEDVPWNLRKEFWKHQLKNFVIKLRKELFV